MIDANHLVSATEIEIGYEGSGVSSKERFRQPKNKQMIEVHKSPDSCIGWSLDPTISLELYRDERSGVNEAEIFLQPEELKIFTQALIRHPILLPISYSQNLSKGRGMYCLRLTSHEPFGDFAERLSAALFELKQTN